MMVVFQRLSAVNHFLMFDLLLCLLTHHKLVKRKASFMLNRLHVHIRASCHTINQNRPPKKVDRLED